MSGKSQPTATVTPARVQLWQPTQRPKYWAGEWIETTWGRCRVTGRLGQRHADVYEALRWCAESKRERAGQTEILVDPARVRRALSDSGYSHQQLWRLLNEIMQAVVEIDAGDLRALGHLIDSVTESKKTRPDPLSGEQRPLWVVRLGLAAQTLDDRDIPLYYDPAPIARLEHGISQAVARHVLTHKKQPRGGWTLDGLIRAVAGKRTEQALWDARRRIRSDAVGLLAAGVFFKDNRLTLAHPPGSMAHPPGSMAHPPGPWHTRPA